jgi:hypothetical protein
MQQIVELPGAYLKQHAILHDAHQFILMTTFPMTPLIHCVALFCYRLTQTGLACAELRQASL